jgi:hypothetical protein
VGEPKPRLQRGLSPRAEACDKLAATPARTDGPQGLPASGGSGWRPSLQPSSRAWRRADDPSQKGLGAASRRSQETDWFVHHSGLNFKADRHRVGARTRDRARAMTRWEPIAIEWPPPVPLLAQPTPNGSDNDERLRSAPGAAIPLTSTVLSVLACLNLVWGKIRCRILHNPLRRRTFQPRPPGLAKSGH